MRILIFAGNFYPHIGGYENYIMNLAKILVKDHDLDILTCNTMNVQEDEVLDKIYIRRVECYNLLDGQYPVPKYLDMLNALEELNKEHYDCVITNTRFFFINNYAARFAKENGAKLIHIEHGTCHSQVSSKVVSMIANTYDHTLGRRLLKKADIVCGVSGSARQFVQHLYKRDTKLLSNFIDTDFFKRKNISKAKTFLTYTGKELGEERVIVTYCGRLIYAKGVQDLIHVCTKFKNVDLLIIGNGNYQDKLANMSIGNVNIFFLGSMNKDQIRDVLSITDIFVNPSYSEGLPTSVLEAGACECAIIASDVGGTGEIISDCRDGLLFNSKNIDELQEKLETFILDIKIRQTFASRIRKTIVDKYSIEAFTKQLNSILDEVSQK
jgi:glycosyltransferase involved in cell wall biosynthesis